MPLPNALPAPRAVRIAGVLVGIQGLAAIAFAVAVLVRGLGSAPKDAGNLYGEAGFFAIVALAVLAVAAGLLLGQRWARTPAAIVELLLVVVAFYAVNSPFTALAVATIVVCIATIVLLFTAPARAWAVTDPSDVS